MTTSNFKILIIDTEAEVLSSVVTILKAEGFSVITCSNSREAIELAVTNAPELVLVDLLMPEMDGIDICIELRKKPELKNSLIVFHTERNEDYSQIAAFNAGADDYIIKPIKARVLISRLNALLKRHCAHNKKAKIETGLQVDRERYVIFKDGEEIILPRKEFELLALLIASPKKVFTRKEISSMVWGYEVFTKNRTIDVHIRKLREKLGENYIKTVKGIGYSIEL
ncbi:MAG TPA: response regulator transcription factor [Bacteroidia bacterium]|jgi:two-component system alkaline phosphatase synthesis response regulator PhoP|nr:response regulator transcription factor [Bacteroidia bacterium]